MPKQIGIREEKVVTKFAQLELTLQELAVLVVLVGNTNAHTVKSDFSLGDVNKDHLPNNNKELYEQLLKTYREVSE